MNWGLSMNKKRLCCRGCKFVYTTKADKNSAYCPRCGRKHHTGQLWKGLLRYNHKYIKRLNYE